MDKITMAQALEAYNLIRKYCEENFFYKDYPFLTKELALEENCHCLFQDENFHCIFLTVNDSHIPCNWQPLDLD